MTIRQTRIKNLLDQGNAQDIDADDIQFLLDLVEQQANEIYDLRMEVYTYESKYSI